MTNLVYHTFKNDYEIYKKIIIQQVIKYSDI